MTPTKDKPFTVDDGAAEAQIIKAEANGIHITETQDNRLAHLASLILGKGAPRFPTVDAVQLAMRCAFLLGYIARRSEEK